MEIQSPKELWNHPDKKVKDFGKGLTVLCLVVSLVKIHRVMPVRSMLHAVHHGEWSSLWAIGGHWWVAAAAALILSTFVPILIRPLYVAMVTVGSRVGFVLSQILLALTYMTLFVVIGAWRRRTSPIAKEFDPGAPSYWKRHAASAAVPRSRYYRQF